MGTPRGNTLQLAGACSQQLTIPSLDITVQELKRLISADAGEAGTLVCGLCFLGPYHRTNEQTASVEADAVKQVIFLGALLQVCQTGLS